ncbi:DUF461 domain-containing protein [Streptomyces sp. NBC_01537]|uniref:DUF461 domain-containing protein n=1 Tax=Streptomyces sp. NBC_01537 TaxID=2903896 RepID=UPI00386FF2EE
MSSSLRRGALAAVLALSIAPLAAACGAGNDAQTLQVKPDNAATTVGDIQIQNAVVLTQSGDGDSVVSARVFNNGSARQTIETVTLGTGGNAALSDKDGGQTIVVPAHGSVLIGGKGNASVTVPGTAEGKRDGDFQQVTFDLSDTGAVTVRALVRPATGYFESFGPTAKPSASASTSPSGSASPTASSSASASASVSASASNKS